MTHPARSSIRGIVPFALLPQGGGVAADTYYADAARPTTPIATNWTTAKRTIQAL